MTSALKRIADESRASQNEEELLWLLGLIEPLKPKIIIEIGVHQGYSVEVWQKAFVPKLIIGVETDLRDLKYDKFQLVPGDSHSPEVRHVVEGKLERQKADMLFIDGDHSYEGVKRDYELYLDLVRPGGVIVFHDVALEGNPQVEVKKFWDQLKVGYRFEEYRADGGTGTGIIWV